MRLSAYNKTTSSMSKTNKKYFVATFQVLPGNPNWKACDTLCYKAKNLYNQTLYQVRKHFFDTGKYLNYNAVQKKAQNENWVSYRALNTKNSQLVMQQVDRDFKSFFSALNAYKKSFSKFTAKPTIPHYRDKYGRSILTFNIQTVSYKEFRKGNLLLSGLPEHLKLTNTIKEIKEVRIVPMANNYKIEVVYENSKTAQKPTGNYKAALDPGVGNMATVVTNNKGAVPFILSGGPLKSINQYYNKRRAKLTSSLDLCKSNRGRKTLQRKLDRLDQKHMNKVTDYAHKVSSVLVNQLVSFGVNELVIGHNSEWKQETNMGRKNNQNFCMMPHDFFFKKVGYKCREVGIQVKHQEEAYTSKCSFLDQEYIGKHEEYAGRRIKRGLYRTSDGWLMNSDVNGSCNILRKGISGVWDSWSQAELIEGFVVNPVRLSVDPIREGGQGALVVRCH